MKTIKLTSLARRQAMQGAAHMRCTWVRACSRWALGVMLLCGSMGMAQAAVENPQVMIQNTLETLQADIQVHHADLKSSPAQLYALVKRDVMPHLDVNYMGALTVGHLWKASSPEVREAFIDQFGRLLTRAYSSALLRVTDYQLAFKPMAPGWESKTFISVSGTIIPKSGGQQPSAVVYYLVNVKGQWKIYDFVVDGVSFLQNYRAQFQSFTDLMTLTERLKSMNEQAA
jgi:phospholipid transport system substrate-binding protein